MPAEKDHRDIVERLYEMAAEVDDRPIEEVEEALKEAARAIERLRAEMAVWAPLVAAASR